MSQPSPKAVQYAKNAEIAWNQGDVDAIVLGASIDCHWRDRVDFLWGREQIRAHILRQARRQLDLRCIIEPWAEEAGRLSLRFVREFRDDGSRWFRVYGNEELEFDHATLVQRRFTAANEHMIEERERALRWEPGPRPHDQPDLFDLRF
uniref:DUF1348 family protein n=1 Tax=uncultured Sphingomonas sp. TaxID=158754 RepID=UPI0035C943F1